jgi:2-iminobutanoate/2-iminopropanoate deaminase
MTNNAAYNSDSLPLEAPQLPPGHEPFVVDLDGFDGPVDLLLDLPATCFGNLVFVAGQTGRHPITGEVGRDVREQTRYAIERIKIILATAGTSLDNVLTVLTHLTKREDLAAYNEEYAKFFPTNKPARTTVEAMLNFPELLVEITVTACIPE